jgi:hypothetical protein
MEPIRTTKTARLRRLKMYREDLDELIAFFVTNCQNVTISDNKNRYESLQEMKSVNGSTVTHLDIRGEKPGVHFLLNQKEPVQGSSPPAVSVFNELRTEEITEEADVLFLKIKEFLEPLQRPSVRWPFLLIAVFAFMGFFISAIRHLFVPMSPPFFPLMFAVGTLICIIPALKVDNLITLDKRADCPSFWSRNKEEFGKHTIMAAISALFGLIVGLVAGWLVGHASK